MKFLELNNLSLSCTDNTFPNLEVIVTSVGAIINSHINAPNLKIVYFDLSFNSAIVKPLTVEKFYLNARSFERNVLNVNVTGSFIISSNNQAAIDHYRVLFADKCKFEVVNNINDYKPKVEDYDLTCDAVYSDSESDDDLSDFDDC